MVVAHPPAHPLPAHMFLYIFTVCLVRPHPPTPCAVPQVQDGIQLILDTQPKAGAAGGGGSREEVVDALCEELLAKVGRVESTGRVEREGGWEFKSKCEWRECVGVGSVVCVLGWGGGGTVCCLSAVNREGRGTRGAGVGCVGHLPGGCNVPAGRLAGRGGGAATCGADTCLFPARPCRAALKCIPPPPACPRLDHLRPSRRCPPCLKPRPPKSG